MTVILAGASAARRWSAAAQDRAALRAAIAALRPAHGPGDLSGAVTLAAAAAERRPARPWS